MNHTIGIDLGGTNLRVAVVDTNTGKVLYQQKAPTLAYEGYEAVIERMVGMVESTISSCGLSREEIGAIGAGVPGTPDIENGIIAILPNLPGQWRNVPLARILQERTGLPAALINDVRATTLAEWTFGAGQGADTIACFAIGTGIGGGLVVNGQLHLGIGGTAGEFGHLVVEKDGPPCSCGGRGCLELYASVPAIAALGVKEVLHGHTTRIGELAGHDLNRITAEVIAQAACEGDRIANEIYRRAGTYLGIAASNVIAAVSPQKVIFGGGGARAGELLIGPVRETVRERVHLVPVEQIEFVQAALGNQAGVTGAALWARKWYEQKTGND